MVPVLFIFFINAVAESIEPEWEEAGIEVPWLSSYSDNDAKQEKRHDHSATCMTGGPSVSAGTANVWNALAHLYLP